jgi:hypothetical protein
MTRFARLFGALAVALVGALATCGTSAALAATPTATTSAAASVTPNSAALVGSVNLEDDNLDGVTAGAQTQGADATGCYFQYGTTTSYGSFVSCTPTPPNGSSTAQAVAAALTGLTAGQTYHFRVVIQAASSAIGPIGVPLVGTTEYDGADQSFTTPSTSTPPTATTAPATLVGSASVVLNASANPENWAISSCSFSYTPSGGSAATVPCSTTPSGSGTQAVTASVGSGLSSGTAYSDALTLTYDNGATVTSSAGSFTTMAASVTAPSGLSATTATLNGTVDPEGQTITACTFYYGTTAANLRTAPCSVAAGQITGTSSISVSAAVSGLTQSSAYVETVILTTSDGALGIAAPAGFTTLTEPKAASAAATAITATTATLHGTVNAGGEGVRACAFEWGVNQLATTASATDNALIVACASTPADSGNQSASVTLTGLAPGTTYYFRVIVTTSGGYVIANTEAFKTLAATPTPTVRLSRSTISGKARTAKFTFARTGSTLVTKGFQCALVTVTKGKAGTPRYTACKSGRSYTKLKATRYVFYVRGGNSTGEGKAVSHRFTV